MKITLLNQHVQILKSVPTLIFELKKLVPTKLGSQKFIFLLT